MRCAATATACVMASPRSVEELDAELALLLVDAPSPTHSALLVPIAAAAGAGAASTTTTDGGAIADLSARVERLESVLDATLDRLEALAVERIETAAYDAAVAVRRALSRGEVPTA